MRLPMVPRASFPSCWPCCAIRVPTEPPRGETPLHSHFKTPLESPTSVLKHSARCKSPGIGDPPPSVQALFIHHLLSRAVDDSALKHLGEYFTFHALQDFRTTYIK